MPQRQLVIHHPDGREDSHVLSFGQYHVGRAVECEIRIPDGRVAPSHVMIFVEECETFVVNLQAADSVTLNGEPLSSRAKMDVGDELVVSGHRMRLEHVNLRGDGQEVSPDGLASVEKSASHDLHLGWMGYRRLLHRISPFVSPSEAEMAEAAYSRGMLLLASVTAFIFLTSLIALWFERSGSFTASAVTMDLAGALGIVGPLVLAGVFRVGFAGRILLPAGAAVSFVDAPASSWDAMATTYTSGYLILLPLLFFLGWGIDYGAFCAATDPRRYKRALVLVIIGFLWIALAFLQVHLELGSHFPYFTAAAGLVCIVWPCWPAPSLRRRCALASPDVVSLVRIAWSRWGRWAGGRLISIPLLVMPVILFLGALGLKDRIAWPDGINALISHDSENVEYSWFWYERGRYLEMSDFVREAIYQVPLASFASTNDWISFTSGISERIVLLQTDPTNATAFIDLQNALDPYLIASNAASAFRRLREPAAAIYYLDSKQTRPTRVAHRGYTIYRAREDLWVFAHSRQAIERLAAGCKAAAWPIAMLTLLGALVLWRRGGDSSLGRWIGVWMIAQSTGLLRASAAEFILPSVNYHLWRESLNNPLAAVLHSWVASLDSLQYVLIVLGLVAQSLVWVRLCWPRLGPPLESAWGRAGVLTGKVLLVAAIPVLLSVLIGIVAASFGAYDSGADPLTGNLVFLFQQGTTVALLVVVGWIMRRKRRMHTEVPHLGGLFAVAIVAAVASTLMPIPMFPYDQNAWAWIGLKYEAPVEWLPSLSVICAGLAIMAGCCFVIAMIRRNVLHLLNATDLAAGMMAVVLPALFEWAENLVQTALQGTILLSSVGTQIMSIAIVVLVLAPSWRLLNRIVKLLTVRDLRRMEGDVEKTLEQLIESSDAIDMRDEISQALHRMGIAAYAFYRRRAGGRFELQMSRDWPTKLPSTMEMSRSLMTFLGRRQALVDYERVAFEWSFFFRACEMYRLEKMTRYRYLLPVCLGPSVRGLLITPDDRKTHAHPSPFVVESMNTMGLVALSERVTKVSGDG